MWGQSTIGCPAVFQDYWSFEGQAEGQEQRQERAAGRGRGRGCHFLPRFHSRCPDKLWVSASVTALGT